jgi:outer membrane protein W
MKFNRIVIVMASVMLASSAHAETATQTTVQEQKTTVSTTQASSTDEPPTAAVVQPAPVETSTDSDKKVDAIKKVRQDIEQKNDSKIVEKLEKTRLEGEKNLADKIDSTNLKDETQKEAAQPQAPVVPEVKIEKVEVVQPAAPAPAAPEVKKEEAKQEEPKRVWYGGIGAGNVIYNGNTLVRSNFGAMVGTMLDEHLAVEGSLIYSSFSLNNYWGNVNNGLGNGIFGSMDQYDVGVAVKYFVFDSARFRPYVGASADYLYRQYKDRFRTGYYWNYDNYTTGQDTNALNAGLLAGMDIKLTERLMIGGEFKYSLPVYAQDNGLITESYAEVAAKPLEQSSFTSWLLSLKFLF